MTNAPFGEKKYQDASDDDTELSFRARVYHTAVSSVGESLQCMTLFPPTQYRTTENKHDFNRALTAYLDTLAWKRVEVTQGGQLAFEINK